MRLLRLILLVILWPVLAIPQQAMAQQDDKGYLTRLLQDSLSSAGRQVNIVGFQGALSSRASLTTLTIADDIGIWLTLRGVTLDWNRAALLQGRVDVTQLTADAIELARLPNRTASDLPATQARSFTLPDLPVSVSIGKLAAARVDLGPAVLGHAVTLSLDGAMTLGNGEGAATLAVTRIDGETGGLRFAGSYATASRQLSLDLALSEGPGGIAATLLHIAGQPPLALTLRGAGPIDDYLAEVTLQTAGIDRLTGTIRRSAGEPGSDEVGRFAADLSGDIAPLFAPAYRSFFGTGLTFNAEGVRLADGSLDLQSFGLKAASVRLNGQVHLNPDGLPDLATIRGHVAAPDGAPVLLPLPGAATDVTDASIALNYDITISPDWTASIGLSNLHRTGFDAGLMALQGSGRVTHANTSQPAALSAGFSFLAAGLGFDSAGLAALLGDSLTGQADLTWASGVPLSLTGASLKGDTYAIEGSGSVERLEADLQVAGRASATVRDLSHLSLLAGRDLSGAASAVLTGKVAILSRAFDLTADVTGRDMAIGQPQADRLLMGQSQVTLSALRDETGTELRQLAMTADGASITARGRAGPTADSFTVQLTLDDLSRLGPPFGGGLSAELGLAGDGIAALQSVTLRGTGADLTTSIPVVDRLTAGQSTVALTGIIDGLALDIARMDIEAATAQIIASGTVTPAVSTVTARVTLPDIAVLAPRLGGAATADATVTLQGAAWQVALRGQGQDLTVGQVMADRLLAGPSNFAFVLKPAGAGLAVTDARLSAAPVALSGAGHYEPGATTLTADVARLDLAALEFWPGGALAGQARVAQVPGGWGIDAAATGTALTVGQTQVDLLLTGQSALTLHGRFDSASGGLEVDAATLQSAGLTASTTGRVKVGETELSAKATLTGLGAAQPGWRGAAQAAGSYREQDGKRLIDVTGSGTGLGTGLPPIDRLLAGETAFALAGSESGGVLAVDLASLSNPQMTATATGTLASASRALVLTARIGDVGLVAPGFKGALAVDGTLADQGGPYQLDLKATAGAALAAQVSGTLARDGRNVALKLSGQADAGLVNGFIAPRSVQGRVSFDLGLTGTPKLASLTGTARIDGLRMVTEYPGIGLTGISGTAVLAGGQARLDLTGQATLGGSVTLQGPLALAAPYGGVLTAKLGAVVLRDPQLYDTSLTGALTITGPLAGGARIAGALDLGPTEVRVPSTGLGGNAIPAVIHLAEPADVRATRDHAGLLRSGTSGGGGGRGGSVAYGLDVQIKAPRQVFIRGRGLDAELGGSVALGGSTAAIVPVGELSLIRGRIDILGKRFTLDEGLARLQGQFVPFVRLVASTLSDGITSSIVVEGNAVAPAISFSSTPQLPEEEVLARLLFGRALTSISPFQAAQLAGAVATLAGRGGDGIIARLRQGFGFDDLDLQSSADGTTALKLGKYIGEKVYTDVTIGSDGKSTLTLNLDLTPDITVRGALGSDGTTGLGVFYEKDY